MILNRYIFTLVCLTPFFIKASPWIEPNDISLRNDIQLLADSGIIKAPTTTFPLMWKAIISDVKETELASLSFAQQSAAFHVMHTYKEVHRSSNISEMSLSLASDNRRFTSFGNSSNEKNKGSLIVSHQYSNQYFSGKLAINSNYGQTINSQTLNENETNFDGSYATLFLGNWAISAGSIPKWWGPSLDTNLIMSTNARPIPAISVSRNSSEAFETPLLSWIGPWTFTAQMAQLEEERYVPNVNMWSTRATIRPFRGLELGGSWSFQWGGKDLPNEFTDFFNALAGKEECIRNQVTCDEEDLTTYGNHIAGWDIRWSDSVLNTPYAIYVQKIGEDRSPGFGLITDKAEIFGSEIRFIYNQQRILLNIEYSNTNVACGKDENAFNCFYEHGSYKSGYRYYTRSIGSTYDNDAETFTTTLLGQLENGHHWQAKLRMAELNSDDRDLFADDILLGHSITKKKETLVQFEGEYTLHALKSDFKIGAAIGNSETSVDEETNINAFISWHYSFQ